jgi:alkanesulfonate monooxygenase SsuD/methylene tetrahydromethanopterin reductase-like flavin-dependent oxidoreductase (luciferase family)
MDKDRAALDNRVGERFKNVSGQMRTEFAVIGTPEEVKRQVESFRDVGVEYFITSFEWDRQVQVAEQFASEVLKNF